MASNGRPATQIYHARQGKITDAMRRVAEREGLEPEVVRQEVARGRMVIPANVNHLAMKLDPMGIGTACSIKINANIGNSAVTSNIDQELEKLHIAVHYGADTVMDLSTGGDIDAIRAAIIAGQHRAHRHRPHLPGDHHARPPGGPDAGRLPGDDRAPGAAGRGLHDHPRRHPPGVPAAGEQAGDGHRQPRRLAAGPVDVLPPQAEPPLRALRRHLRHLPALRRDLQPRRQPAARLPGRRQRRGPVRRAAHPGRADAPRPGPRTAR